MRMAVAFFPMIGLMVFRCGFPFQEESRTLFVEGFEYKTPDVRIPPRGRADRTIFPPGVSPGTA